MVKGLDVQQRLAGCELWDHGRPDQITSSDAFNGVGGEGLHFSNKDSYAVESNWATKWTTTKQQIVKSLYKNFYLPVCLKTLKSFLKTTRSRVLRRVKPRVRLLQKTLQDSGGAKVTCLATGFYPRHINLTLLRDGQPVSDHQVTGGELLPNGDETYQMRKSLEVSAEELQHHHYTCTAEHLSLDNKLDIHLEREWTTAPIASSVAVLLGLLGVTCGIIVWRRRHAGQGSNASLQSIYSEASSERVKRSTAQNKGRDDKNQQHSQLQTTS
ncbi:major histocompatibility complex class I-related gene protein-like [Sardina pilchardus]|uniref:major histocompatibility complex class I-related gene protein-like n=1 Tax=Sardina pilchardus TaxID=27697 RepID=UPI002E151FCC